jgi:hypothetical protein
VKKISEVFRKITTDPFVVSTEALGRVLARVKEQAEQAGDPSFTLTLAEKLGVDEGVLRRLLDPDYQREFPWTPFGKADAILSAIGEPYLLWSEVRVYFNPYFDPEEIRELLRRQGLTPKQLGVEEQRPVS